MSVTSLYPVLMSNDVAATAAFYRSTLGFETTFEIDWYVSLRLGNYELAILAYDHDSIPQEYRKLAQGVLVNVEVNDVDELYKRLLGESVEIVQPLRDEAFGQRHFIVAAPDGVLLDVIQPIPPTGEFVDAYNEAPEAV